jgi:excisionase family DNA binding protein
MSNPPAADSVKWLTPARAAAKFGVTAHSVRLWADAGKVTCIRTLGGHRRYREAEIQAFLERSVTSQTSR